jgi:hypothetical protein
MKFANKFVIVPFNQEMKSIDDESELDTKIKEILNSKYSADQKVKLYNIILSKYLNTKAEPEPNSKDILKSIGTINNDIKKMTNSNLDVQMKLDEVKNDIKSDTYSLQKSIKAKIQRERNKLHIDDVTPDDNLTKTRSGRVKTPVPKYSLDKSIPNEDSVLQDLNNLSNASKENANFIFNKVNLNREEQKRILESIRNQNTTRPSYPPKVQAIYDKVNQFGKGWISKKNYFKNVKKNIKRIH